MPRANGEGSIYQRADGRWVAQFKPRGRPRRYRYRQSEDAARDALHDLIDDARQGIKSSRKALGAHIGEWLEYKQSVLRLSVHSRYCGLLNLHVVPRLGKVAIADLQPADLTRHYSRLSKTLSASSIGQLHRVLRQCLDDAVNAGYSPRNPARLVRPPRVPRYQPVVLTLAQARRLLDVAKDDPLEGFYWLGMQGMRSGEICALKWADVDLKAQRLHVRATVFWDKDGWHLEEPKTEMSRRPVELMPSTVSALDKWRISQIEQRMRSGPAWQDNGFVFTDGQGRPLRQSSVLNYNFRPLLERAGFPPALQKMRVHDLRHSLVSMLLAAGVDVATISRIVGHASPAVTTAIYSHMLPGADRAAADMLSGMLGHHVVRVE